MAGVPGLNPLVVLGATGSIGRQALQVAHHLGIEVVGLAARRGSADLLELARQWPQADVAVSSPTQDERERLATEVGGQAAFGPEAVAALAGRSGVTVVNGIVGSVGLEASVAALLSGNRLALANKESLVAGGPVVEAAQRAGGGELLPVDSEHSALAQCLGDADPATVRRILLTASGGPFRGRSAEELEAVTVEEAMAHPTWSMGRRITIDSATLMNKGFEVIEAHYLFAIEYDRIDVVVHPQSIVHGMVEFVDGAVLAHLGLPDMRLPLQYAISHPARLDGPVPPFDFTGLELTFEAPDRSTFRCLDLAYAAGRKGGSAPTVLNAADEVAVQAFTDGRIGFRSIPVVVEQTLERVEWRALESVTDVGEVDREARATAWEVIGTAC